MSTQRVHELIDLYTKVATSCDFLPRDQNPILESIKLEIIKELQSDK